MARESSSQSRGTAQSARTRETQQRSAQNAGRDRERTISTSRETAQPSVRGQGLARSGDGGRRGIGIWSASNPFVMMQRMAEDMEQLMDEFGRGRPGLAGAIAQRPGMRSLAGAEWSPQIEVRQQGDRIVVRADLPGVKREDVHIDVENDLLTIRGERREERTEEEGGFVRSERMYGQFSRTIPLPSGVDPEECEAKFQDGVLEVSIPMPSQNQRRGKRIEIR